MGALRDKRARADNIGKGQVTTGSVTRKILLSQILKGGAGMFGHISVRDRSKGGFTLIELLVVIAIIAILAALLFPVFTKARDSARLSRCLAHLGQIGKAIHAYCDDNDGRMPIGPQFNYSTRPPTIITGWVSQFIGGISKGVGATFPEPKDRPLFKYTSGNLEMWRCPAEQKQHNDDRYTNEFPSKYWGTSYVMNGVYMWYGSWPTNREHKAPFYTLMGHSEKSGADVLAPRKMSEIRNHTKLWMVGERTMHYYWNLKYKGNDPSKAPLGHMESEPFSPVVFVDGHTGTIRMTEDVLVDPNRRWGFIERGWHPDPAYQKYGL